MLLYWSSIIALVAVVGCGYLVGATLLDFFTYLKSAFDQLHREVEREPKMMSIGLHPRLVGRPERADALARFMDYVQRTIRRGCAAA
jgi:hypothetical protein